MADLPGRPTGITAAPIPGADLAAPGGERIESYRPLSLLAILGFLIGLFYAVLVVLGGLAGFVLRYPRLVGLLTGGAVAIGLVVALVRQRRGAAQMAVHAGAALLVVLTILGLGSLMAFTSSNPWQWPASLWPVPLAGIVVSWIAASRIRASENTLSGAPLARWGLGLSLCFGILYSAYLLSNNVAVSNQASVCAEEFLDLIRQGDVPQAFLRTLPPRSRPAPGTDIRRILEVEHNVPRGITDGSGAYATFTRVNFVELIRLGGPEATWAQANVDTPEFDRGTYRVGLTYDVTSPFGRFSVRIATVGQEAADEAGGVRRKWHVDQNGTSLLRFAEITPERKRYDLAKHYANEVVRTWLTMVRAGNTSFAYLLTLPNAQRRPQSACAALEAPALAGAVGVGLAGGLGVDDELLRKFKTGREAFRTGKELLDVSEFWADPTRRDEMPSVRESILQDVRALLAGGPHRVREMAPLEAEIPFYQVTGGEMRFRIPVSMATGEGPKRLHYLEADVEVAGPAAAQPGPETFHIVKLRLIRGRTALDPRSGPRGGQ